MAYKYEASHAQAQQPTFINLFISLEREEKATTTYKMDQVPANCMGKLPSAEVDPMLNLAKDGTLWKEMADLKPQQTLSAGQQVEVGGSIFNILNPKDPAVIEIGKFAVEEHNKKAGTNLEFVEVATGLKLHVPVINACALLIRANDGQQTQVYGAVVVEAPVVLKELLFWIFVPYISLP